ncbi:hypothetical protein P3T76_013897 [Phytophthora citrophthora]|uniref:Uncharacterized protein n=1 Tax=Phytophthora citrophthora TaxID=4793 RepID=A0AAD9LBN9_9STRA|nr:hypothetical protein P3T76_013897 [Phytophthora citrophthora]
MRPPRGGSEVHMVRLQVPPRNVQEDETPLQDADDPKVRNPDAMSTIYEHPDEILDDVSDE